MLQQCANSAIGARPLPQTLPTPRISSPRAAAPTRPVANPVHPRRGWGTLESRRHPAHHVGDTNVLAGAGCSDATPSRDLAADIRVGESP
ncbi:hypothetical protein Q4I32_005918 [Leishmania shawi]|uniref:Uncharacterized protein n=1 Tax=Leishmania shawi TaxID=5680 RepID=A0AAW3BIT4_9TRYP